MENALSVNNHKQYKGDECPPLFCVQTSQFQTRGGRRSARGSRRVAVGAWRSERGGQGARRWARGGRLTARAHGEGARRPEARIIRSRRGGWRGCARDVAALCRGLPLRGRIFGRPPRPSAACAAAGRVDGEPWRARGPQIRARRSGPSGGQARRRTRDGPNAIPSSTTGLPYVVTASPAPARFLWHFWRAARTTAGSVG